MNTNTNKTDISVNTLRHTIRDHSLGIFVHDVCEGIYNKDRRSNIKV